MIKGSTSEEPRDTNPQEQHERIRQTLHSLERDEGMRVLYAVESGSRAWGFESPDSDWDVRFIYVRPADSYLSIHPPRDVIERSLPGDLDLAGWDLPKALRLMSKSNPALMEWLRSPIVYREDSAFVSALRELETIYASRQSGIYHYRSMAVTNYRSYFQDGPVKLKKYLYVLRPILACRSFERTDTWPPVRFLDLVESEIGEAGLRGAIDDLLAMKAKTSEVGQGMRIPVLDRYIEVELARLQGISLHEPRPRDLEPLDRLFRQYARG